MVVERYVHIIMHKCTSVPSLAGAGLRTRLGDPLDGSVSASSACFATPPNCHVIFVCGFWDNSYKCFATDSSGTYTLSHTVQSSMCPPPTHTHTQARCYRVCLAIWVLSLASTSLPSVVSMETKETA